jgi:hypothetical protein
VSSDNPFVDDAGDQVLRFVSAARNLSRLGELTDEVTAIAKSGSWRRYRTAVGTDEWRECEFDYFLIACDLGYDDISRILAYTGEGSALAPLMDREADPARRRTFEEAGAAWHAPVPETLINRAQRLGWTKGQTGSALRAAPLPRRIRARQAHGMSMDEHARRTRQERITTQRRGELDELVSQLVSQLAGDTERLYVIDHLRAQGRRGRPGADSEERARWAADAQRLGWNAAKLAEEWGIGERAAWDRMRQARQPELQSAIWRLRTRPAFARSRVTGRRGGGSRTRRRS